MQQPNKNNENRSTEEEDSVEIVASNRPSGKKTFWKKNARPYVPSFLSRREESGDANSEEPEKIPSHPGDKVIILFE